MLSCLVTVRFQSRQTVANAACFTTSISFNSFTSFSFCTLAPHFQTSVSSNPCKIKRFRTLCKTPGIGYPPPPIFPDRHSIRSPRFPAALPSLRSASARIAHFFATSLFRATLTFFMGGRGVSILQSQNRGPNMKLGSTSPAGRSRLPRDQNALADRPVLGRKRPSHVRGDAIHRTLYDLGKVRDTRCFEVDCKWGIGSNQPPHPIHPKGAPLEV
jgi:hypothetical protein